MSHITGTSSLSPQPVEFTVPQEIHDRLPAPHVLRVSPNFTWGFYTSMTEGDSIANDTTFLINLNTKQTFIAHILPDWTGPDFNSWWASDTAIVYHIYDIYPSFKYHYLSVSNITGTTNLVFRKGIKMPERIGNNHFDVRGKKLIPNSKLKSVIINY